MCVLWASRGWEAVGGVVGLERLRVLWGRRYCRPGRLRVAVAPGVLRGGEAMGGCCGAGGPGGAAGQGRASRCCGAGSSGAEGFLLSVWAAFA